MHTTQQLNTALAGRYVIERRVGEGGMAAVYLARDVRHNRQVALKVLNPELGVVLGSERFMAEIEVTANLHHPNLLPLFDSGEAGGLLFYVMPYVEGETLRKRLQRERQLGVEDAVRIAVAIASALDYAHRHQIIHRDLKPENILMHEGQPLVMDFGIALAVSRAGGARITQTGLSLGTPQYMSPEQATGDHALDGRTDIYSLGAVLYEMLVGDPPHTGSTVQAVIAKVITEQPSSVRATRPNVPEHVEAALFKALAKLPADRFTSAADFCAALEGTRPVTHATFGAVGAASRGIATPVTPRLHKREIAAWSLVVLAIGAAVWWGTRAAREPVPQSVRLAVELPAELNIERPLASSSIAMSRDGRMLAFSAQEGRQHRLYLRRLDNIALHSIADNGSAPSFSPDGKWVAFLDDRNRLFKVPVDSGTPQLLADSAFGGGTWGDKNRIVYAHTSRAIMMVDAITGERRRLAAPESGSAQRFVRPHVLPGGDAALFSIATNPAEVSRLAVVTIPEGKIKDLGIRGGLPQYSDPGYLVFHSADGILMAAPFSIGKLEVTGPAVRFLENVTVTIGDIADYAVSRNGAIAFRWRPNRSLSPTQLVTVDRSGKARAVKTADVRSFSQPRVSPDGRRVAVRVGGERYNTGDLWVLELGSGGLTRITSDNGSYRATWSRDGSRLFYIQGNVSDTRIVTRPWDGSGTDSVLLSAPNIAEFSEGIRGGWSAVRTLGGRDIHLVPTDSVREGKRVPYVVTPSNENEIALSPDGRWIAYTSDETNRLEVYVRPVPGPGGRVLVSVDGGSQPLWSRDGNTLYYRGSGWLRAARVSRQPTFEVTRRDSLFRDTYLADAEGTNYAVMPGDREFLMVAGGGPQIPTRMAVILNWPSLLSRGRGADEPR